MSDQKKFVVKGRIQGKISDYPQGKVEKQVTNIKGYHYTVRYNSISQDQKEQVLNIAEYADEWHTQAIRGFTAHLSQESENSFSYLVQGISRDGVNAIGEALNQLNFTKK